MYLLDTYVLIWILRGRDEIIDKISQLKEKSPVCISVISIAEIYQNIFPSELPTTEEFLNLHNIFEVDAKIAKIAGLYFLPYSTQLQNLSLADRLIPAPANPPDLSPVPLHLKPF